MMKFYTHRNNYLRRYDHEIIKGEHIDVGTALIVADLNQTNRDRTVVVKKITPTFLSAIRIYPHNGMREATNKITLLPRTSIAKKINGVIDFNQWQKDHGPSIVSFETLVTEVSYSRVEIHFPSVPYEFLELEVDTSDPFWHIQGGLYFHSQTAI